MGKNFGFPRMHKEKNERRDFLPEFFGALKGNDIGLLLEEGYGSKMGYLPEDYLKENETIEFRSHEEVYASDVVLVLRAPTEDEINLMKRGSALLTMLHYPTHDLRNKLILENGIFPFSLDSMANDDNKRVVFSPYGTSYNGARVALETLEAELGDESLNRPFNILILGAGEIGLMATKAFKDLSNERLRTAGESYSGMKVTVLTRSITGKDDLLRNELENADILVDATFRPDPTRLIVKNELIGALPAHAVILDITADPYDFETNPPQLKAIEGIPTGSLNQMVFEVDDSVYDEYEGFLSTENRRRVVSCGAWPGVDPKGAMNLYAKQILPVLDVIIEKGYENISLDSKVYYERVLYRSTYEYFTNY